MQRNNDKKHDSSESFFVGRRSSFRMTGGVASYQRPKSHGASTLEALNYSSSSSKTLPEFSHYPLRQDTEARIIIKRCRFVALELISLWVPRTDYEISNSTLRFLYNPQNDTMGSNQRYPLISAVPFHSVEPRFIKEYFAENNPCHLGSLIFLNYLLEGNLADNNLFISENAFHESLTFLQFPHLQFFKGFFANRSAQDNSFDMMNIFKDGEYQAWWSQVFPDNVVTEIERIAFLRNLFLEEIFATVLRVYFTPVKVIKDIINKLLGDKYTFKAFINHVFYIKNNVISYLTGLLTAEECVKWHEFREQKSLQVYKIFKQDLREYLVKLDYDLWTEVFRKTILESFMHAAWLKIPGLLETAGTMDNSRSFLPIEKGQEVSYIFSLIEENWDKIGRFSDHDLWIYFNNLCESLHSELTNNGYKLADDDSDNSNNLLCAIMMAAIRFKYNNVCRFLLLHYPFMKNWVIVNSDFMSPPYNRFIGLSLRDYTLAVENDLANQYFSDSIENKLRDVELSVEKEIKTIADVPEGRPRSSSLRSSEIDDDLPFAKTQSRTRRPRLRSFTSLEDLQADTTITKSGVDSTYGEPIMSFEEFSQAMFPSVDLQTSSSLKEDNTSSSQTHGIFFPALCDSDDTQSKEESYGNKDSSSKVYGYGSGNS